MQSLLNTPAVEAVCFDLDGTLCISTYSDNEFTDRVFERAGLNPSFVPSAICIGESITDMVEVYYSGGE